MKKIPKLSPGEKLVFEETLNKEKECWLWEGHRNWQGYGRVGIKASTFSAHRVAWTVFHGEIPEGMCVLHRCDNPPCCNPSHLWLGTWKENNQDKGRKGRCNAAFGEKAGRAKFSNEEMKEVKRLLSIGWSQSKVARKYNVKRQSIWAIFHGISWRSVTTSISAE